MMKAYEAPAVIEINRELLDAVIDKYVTDNAFTITVSDGKNSTEVQFKHFIHALDLGVFYRQALGVKPLIDKMTGCFMLDVCGIELATHAFIFANMSTMPPLAIERDGEQVLDVQAIGTYGNYFRAINEDYNACFQELFNAAVDICTERIEAANHRTEQLFGSFDATAVMSSPEYLGIFKDVVKEQFKTSEAAAASNDLSSAVSEV